MPTARGAKPFDSSSTVRDVEGFFFLNGQIDDADIALNKISGDWDPRKLAQLLDELVQAPNFSQMDSTIACLRLACQQYHAALGSIASSMATRTNLSYRSEFSSASSQVIA